jgi:hypothetical protein
MTESKQWKFFINGHNRIDLLFHSDNRRHLIIINPTTEKKYKLVKWSFEEKIPQEEFLLNDLITEINHTLCMKKNLPTINKNNLDFFSYTSNLFNIVKDFNEFLKPIKNEFLNQKDDENKKERNVVEYIYLLQEREFSESNKLIYKLGKSKQENIARFRQYPKGSVLLFQKICKDCDSKENILKEKFKEKYIQHTEIGIEYFEGDYNEMIQDIFLTI